MALSAETAQLEWSQSKQLELEIWKIRVMLADTSSLLRNRVTNLFETLKEIDLTRIGTEDRSEPRSSA